ncbi:MAG: Pyridoxal-5-phosphate-dependent enzyme beta subunit [Bryobacterales bacterium]|nr:Pyridoxal-5-phosphate-dependent enzyme beta subunit [Bryobacterales bacterium]
MNSVSEAMVREAAERIRPLARRTPVMTSLSVDSRAGSQVFFKCENLQRGGAFKIRGAANLVLSIPKADLPRGVVAFSSGNHAQGTAIAARYAGTAATIVMPEDAPRSKMEATRDRGARIVTYNRFTDDREAIAAAVLSETNGTLVPPFDHPLIIAGQGTTALELMEEIPDLDALVVCVGGGGLISGCATIAKAIKPSLRIFGVEPELANDTWQSFRKGSHVTIPSPDTIADGLRSPSPGKLTFPIIQELVEDIVLVSEDEIRATVRLLLERMKLLVEPSGAVGAAAVLFGKIPQGLRRVGVVISGGNVDLEFLSTC